MIYDKFDELVKGFMSQIEEEAMNEAFRRLELKAKGLSGVMSVDDWLIWVKNVLTVTGEYDREEQDKKIRDVWGLKPPKRSIQAQNFRHIKLDNGARPERVSPGVYEIRLLDFQE